MLRPHLGFKPYIFNLEQFLVFLDETEDNSVDDLFKQKYDFYEFCLKLTYLTRAKFSHVLETKQKIQLATWLILHNIELNKYNSYGQIEGYNDMNFKQIGISLFTSLIHNE